MRGNELGFIISNSIFWPKVKPRSVLLGASVKQHIAVRPIVDQLYSRCDGTCYSRLVDSATKAQSGTSLKVQEDVKKWVFRELWKITFPGEANPINEDEFFRHTNEVCCPLSTITQLLPGWLGRAISSSTISKMEEYFNIMLPLVQKHYGNSPSIKDGDCSPTPGGCVNQLTSAFLDTLLAAGGLSVPSAISTGLWILYGNTAGFPDFFDRSYTLSNYDPAAFMYESMRFFAPVVGLPWWTKKPARATDDTANQMEGGERHFEYGNIFQGS